MDDLRNELAKARDEWMESDEGWTMQQGSAAGQYLKNRLERAFIAGWQAHELDERKVIRIAVNETREENAAWCEANLSAAAYECARAIRARKLP